MSRITRRTIIPVNQITPLTYRDGVTYIQMLTQLSEYIKGVLHPSLQHTVDQIVADVEAQMDTHHDQYVDGVQEFQRIHDAFMSDVNAHLIALNDSAVSDLAEDGTSLLSGVLRDLFSPRSETDEILVNVKHFGAVGDGVADDTDAFQDAIQFVSQRFGGGTVFVPNGTYMIFAHDPDSDSPNYLRGRAGGIILENNITLRLDADATLQAITNDERAYNVITAYNASNVTVEGGNIQGDLAHRNVFSGEYGYGIAVSGDSYHVTVKNTNISHMFGDGINLQNGTPPGVATPNGDSTPHHVTIENVTSTHNRRQGLSVEAVVNLIIRDSEFSETGVIRGTLPMCGIDIEPWGNNNLVDNVLIENCVFKNNGGPGITTMMDHVHNVSIRGCVFESNAQQTRLNSHIMMYDGGENWSVEQCVFRGTVGGGAVHVLRGRGRVVRNCVADTRVELLNTVDYTMSGNSLSVDTPHEYGVSLTGSSSGVMAHNVIESDALGFYGIRAYTSGANRPTVIDGNTIISPSSGIRFVGEGDLPENIHIVNNSITAGGTGVQLRARKVAIQGNIIDAPQSIVLSSANSVLHNVSGNIVNNIVGSGQDSVIVNNITV